MPFLSALILTLNFVAAAQANECSKFRNARYEEYWGTKEKLAGKMVCAVYGMEHIDCLGLSGEFKPDEGSGHDVCFILPKTSKQPTPAPFPPPEPTPPPKPIPLPKAPPSPVVEKGSATFSFINKTRCPVNLLIHSTSRRKSWPSGGTFWELEDEGQKKFTISCKVGEILCFGAWNSLGEGSWGIGRHRERNCSDCCTTCEPEGQNTDSPEFTIRN